MTTRQRCLRGHAVDPGEPNNYHRWTAPTCRCGCGRDVPQRGRYRCYASEECYRRAMDAYRPGRGSR